MSKFSWGPQVQLRVLTYNKKAALLQIIRSHRCLLYHVEQTKALSDLVGAARLMYMILVQRFLHLILYHKLLAFLGTFLFLHLCVVCIQVFPTFFFLFFFSLQ